MQLLWQDVRIRAQLATLLIDGTGISDAGREVLLPGRTVVTAAGTDKLRKKLPEPVFT